MAGGAGTRLWPESRQERPKQLLTLEGDRTMIQATVDRLGDLMPPDRVIVATTQRLAGRVHEQLSQLPRESIVAEPCPRNTAPCIALAAMRILCEDPEGTMVVLPADHVIAPPEVFQRAIRFGAALVEEDPQRLITFGIKPTYPAETFGYIERAEPLEPPARFEDPPAAYRVRRFHEKPSAEVARQYLEAGIFYWNAGIFLWKARTIWEALQRFEPEMFSHLERIAQAVDSDRFAEVLRSEFEAIQGKSIDYAVMERAEGVVVVEAPFRWDDVGSWRALQRLRPSDSDGNLLDAARVINIDSTGSIVRAHDPNHVVALVGVEGLIVITTADATLVAHKDKEESIRRVIEELKQRGWTEYL